MAEQRLIKGLAYSLLAGASVLLVPASALAAAGGKTGPTKVVMWGTLGFTLLVLFLLYRVYILLYSRFLDSNWEVEPAKNLSVALLLWSYCCTVMLSLTFLFTLTWARFFWYAAGAMLVVVLLLALLNRSRQAV